ncbi:MAG: GGDEF domain-containing protein [Candidatus Brocadiia bacterium]
MAKQHDRHKGQVWLKADWPERQTRVLVLSVVLLFALVYAHVLFTLKFAEPNFWLRSLSWVVCGYSFVVLVIGTRWGWKAHRLAQRHATEKSEGIDSLTGLPNWQGTASRLSETLYGEIEGDKHTWLLYLQLQGLEGTNYEHGRTAGDMLLQEVSRLIESHVPKDGTVGRVGGSEFIIALPLSESEKVERLSDLLKKEISRMTVDLGPWGQISGLHLSTEIIPYKPGKTTLSQVMDSLHTSKQRTESVSGLEAVSEDIEIYHLPEITLEAFAVHRWNLVPKNERSQYQVWRWNPKKKFVNIMVADIMKLIEVRVQKGDIDFVTAPPVPASQDQREAAATQALGRAVAKQLGVPFKRTLKAVVSGTSGTKHVDAHLDSSLPKGAGIVLVQDLITSPKILRRSVRELSSEGCHVLVLGWAFDTEAAAAGRGLQSV